MKSFLAKARMILTLECNESTRIVSESLDRDMTRTERWAVRLHYIGCWSCRRFRKQLMIIQDALRARRENEDQIGEGLTAEARQKIRRSLEHPPS